MVLLIFYLKYSIKGHDLDVSETGKQCHHYSESESTPISPTWPAKESTWDDGRSFHDRKVHPGGSLIPDGGTTLCCDALLCGSFRCSPSVQIHSTLHIFLLSLLVDNR